MVNRSLNQLTADTYSNSQTFCREIKTSHTTAIICTRTNAPKCILGLHRLNFREYVQPKRCNFKPWLELFFLKVIPTISFLCSSSSPLLSLSHKYQWNKPSTCPYITYIQGGRQDRKTGNWRKLQHYMRKGRRKIKCNPQTMLHWGVQCENRKKNTSAQKHIYHKHNFATGGNISLAEAGWYGGAREDKIELLCLWGEQLHTFTAILSVHFVHSGLRKHTFSLAKPWASSW